MIFDKIDFIFNKNLPNWKKILGSKTLKNNINKKKSLSQRYLVAIKLPQPSTLFLV